MGYAPKRYLEIILSVCTLLKYHENWSKLTYFGAKKTLERKDWELIAWVTVIRLSTTFFSIRFIYADLSQTGS